MPSVKPESSTRNSAHHPGAASWSPSASSRIVRPSSTADQASAGAMFDAVGADGLRDPGRRDQPADDALAGIGLQPVDPHGLVGQPLPDRQQQAGDDVEIGCR